MPTPSKQQLLIALSNDFNKSGTDPVTKFVDESARKTFTANKDGVLFEFAHNQPDGNYWNGIKHYSSGKQSRIRFPRTQSEPALPV
jgi:predicted lactoylglutathione lyase